jgi:hypothetical protein
MGMTIALSTRAPIESGARKSRLRRLAASVLAASVLMTNFAVVGVVATAQPAAAHHWTNCDNAAVYCNARISKVSSTELKIVGNMSSYKRGDLEMHLSLYENGVPLGNWKRSRCFNATSCERTWILPLCKPGNRYEAYIEFRRFNTGGTTATNTNDDSAFLNT